MPDIKIVQFPLEKLFRSKRGNSNYTKKYCNTHIGEYEVYTGTTIGSFGKINIYEYSTPQLTYTTDGEYAGTVALIEDEKFNIGGHRAILISKGTFRAWCCFKSSSAFPQSIRKTYPSKVVTSIQLWSILYTA